MSDPAMRERVVRQVREQERAEREVVAAKARRLGLALRVVHEDGRVMELVGFEGDKPVYVTTMNQNAAISGGVVPLRTSPYGLSGEGARVGVWDEGGRSSHQEFASMRG